MTRGPYPAADLAGRAGTAAWSCVGDERDQAVDDEASADAVLVAAPAAVSGRPPVIPRPDAVAVGDETAA